MSMLAALPSIMGSGTGGGGIGSGEQSSAAAKSGSFGNTVMQEPVVNIGSNALSPGLVSGILNAQTANNNNILQYMAKIAPGAISAGTGGYQGNQGGLFGGMTTSELLLIGGVAVFILVAGYFALRK